VPSQSEMDVFSATLRDLSFSQPAGGREKIDISSKHLLLPPRTRTFFSNSLKQAAQRIGFQTPYDVNTSHAVLIHSHQSRSSHPLSLPNCL
jgi:hypothetical protein